MKISYFVKKPTFDERLCKGQKEAGKKLQQVPPSLSIIESNILTNSLLQGILANRRTLKIFCSVFSTLLRGHQ